MSDSSSVSIAALLKKTEHYDKDERYMATSDLCEVLKRQKADSSMGASSGGGGGGGASASSSSSHHHHHHHHNQQQQQQRPLMDTATEKQICTAVLTLLHDKSNDVQAIAVKTLGVLLTAVQQEQVSEIADSLADQVLDASKSELRDVYAIGLRTLVKTIPANMGHRVSQRLVGRLLDGIRTTQQEEICLACLDILTDLLARFGASAPSVTRQHEPILQTCLGQLVSAENSPVVRKRAGNTMAGLSVVLSDALLQRMVEALLTHIDRAQGVGKAGRRQTQRDHNNRATTTTTTTTSSGDTRALIRTMCTVSGAVGHRLGQEQIDRILPIFLRFTHPEDAITGDDEEDDDEDEDVDMQDAATGNNDDEAATALANELRESCFMGFESFVLRCPTEVEPHLQSIIQAALAYMSYDPNYSYGQEDDEGEGQEAGGGGGDEDEDYELEDEEENEYGDDEDDDDEDDDDDESWKVRRSAIRALKAVVEAKQHDPSTLWTTPYVIRKNKKGAPTVVAAALVQRFKEREENCRVGIIECFDRLLAVTVAAAKAGTIALKTPTTSTTKASGQEEDKMDTTTTTTQIDLRTLYAPKLVKACVKILAVKKGNERAKSGALSLLATLCQAPGGVGGQAEISTVFAHVQTFLATDGSGGSSSGLAMHREGTSKALRLDALLLVHAMLATNTHDPAHVRVGLKQTLLAELCQAVKEQWYKVIAEALRALAQVPHFFVVGYKTADGDEEMMDDTARSQEQTEVATMLYTAMEPLLAAHDVDQEIKECALKASASLLSYLHSSLTQQQQERLLQLLLDRLQNETTRMAAIKTLTAIASEQDGEGCTLEPILADSISTLASFLKLQSRSLKQGALEALDRVVSSNQKTGMDAESQKALYANVLCDLAPLVVDSDLHLTHLSLRACVSILQVCTGAGPAAVEHVLGRALDLSTSSLLQDLPLDSLLLFFKQIILSQAMEFTELLKVLKERLGDQVTKTGIYNLAKCIATITATTTTDNCKAVLGDIFSLLEATSTPSDAGQLRQVQLSLLVTGDLGKMVDLNTMDGAADKLKSIYVAYFESPSEELKHAAAYALGSAAVGSPAKFLQEIVSQLGGSSEADAQKKKQQYLLLSALREFIQSSFRQKGGEGVANSIPVIVPPLEQHCAEPEEGVRTMVAECLGILTCLQPETMLPKLQKLLEEHSAIAAPGGNVADDDAKSKENALICWTVATSVKLAIPGKVDATELSSYMPSFLKLLEQEELNVRNAALLMVYSAAHHMPQVVSGLLKDPIVPALYQVAALKMERKVDLGPFTHTVDDALPLRKAALSIFATCLENLPGNMDIAAFMPVLARALGDSEDIQLHAHQIVISMCARQPTYVVASVDSFTEPLEKTMNKKPGTKTGTELERLNDWIKSALRVMLVVSKLEGAMSSRKFAEFVERVKGNSKFTGMLASLEEEQT